MGQEVGKLPETDVTVPCGSKVTADVIQTQIRNRGAAFATTPDADLLRAASKWVSDQYSWILSDLHLAVYGMNGSWVFYAGSRSNQVAFHATSKNIDEPAWERKGWKTRLYYGSKMVLKVIGAVLPLGAPVIAAIPALGPAVAGGMAAGGAVAATISDYM